MINNNYIIILIMTMFSFTKIRRACVAHMLSSTLAVASTNLEKFHAYDNFCDSSIGNYAVLMQMNRWSRFDRNMITE